MKRIPTQRCTAEVDAQAVRHARGLGVVVTVGEAGVSPSLPAGVPVAFQGSKGSKLGLEVVAGPSRTTGRAAW